MGPSSTPTVIIYGWWREEREGEEEWGRRVRAEERNNRRGSAEVQPEYYLCHPSLCPHCPIQVQNEKIPKLQKPSQLPIFLSGFWRTADLMIMKTKSFVCCTSSFFNPLLGSLFSATRAGSHQFIHLQPASVYGRAGAGEHAETFQPSHFHSNPPWRQWNQPRGGLCQVKLWLFCQLFKVDLWGWGLMCFD